jgi:hypothetical protein
VKENSMKGNIHFFLFRCYGNQASVKFLKKSWKNLMDTTFGLCIRDPCPIILIFIFMREKSYLEVVAL